ncbi:Fibrinogen beta chain Fibrinopeptide B Fibrinogen beta chain Precursor [Channa argus]|uniref:Fibrinogen beta chain n=1 Tax=Channa argus TaxID=215402 RepID=A0A6G1Q744_CHAAH|nr:Fibrinogen beta chain Fibrinopeptide B Fibrinogen beta chain Precursor [Channa argus]
MRTLLLLYLCVYAAWAQGTSDYDEDDDTDATVDARGHRPLTRDRETYNPSRYVPPPISGGGRYRGRPTEAPVGQHLAQEKVEQPEAGGCTHASDEMGVLCPNGCELKTTLLKQERSVKTSINDLKPQVEELSRSSNNIYTYVNTMSNSLRDRHTVINENTRVVRQYTDQVEEQHVFIKDVVDNVFPSSIRVLHGVLDKIKQKIERLEKAIQAQREGCKEPCKTKCPIPVVSGKECEDIFRRGGKKSQMYLIQIDDSTRPYKVFCDQTSKEGGWLLIQNRLDGSVDFGRRWDEYRRGFGNIAFDVGKGHCETPGEYWLGNDRISQLTKMGPTEILIEMQDWTGAKVYAQYRQFTIQSDTSNYVLAVDGYSGTAGNGLLEGALQLFGVNRTMTIHNGMMFSTFDRDNDNWNPGDPSKQCSREDGGGWWYNRCHSANPNGRYYIGGAYNRNMAKHGTDDGIVWMNWKGSWYSLKAISMKIKPFFAST